MSEPVWYRQKGSLQTSYLQWAKKNGISKPEAMLSIREAVKATGVAERTIRRYIADGTLATETVKGPRGDEHRILAPELYRVTEGRKQALIRATGTPVEQMAEQLEQLTAAFEQRRQAEAEAQLALLAQIEKQTQVIDQLRAEQRDARAEMHQLREQMVKALMPPSVKLSWVQRIFGKKE